MDTTLFKLSAVDLWLGLAYLVAIIAIGLFLSRYSHNNAEGYFLANRAMLWPFIGISLFASNISSTTLIGLAGEAYNTGISVFNYEWMASIILVFYCFFMLPQVLRSRVYTMPEFLERRFNSNIRKYFSLLTLFLNIVVDTAGSLYAGGLLLKLVFPEIPLWQTITLLAVVAGIYTIVGGLSAVIYTDTLQGVLLIIGSVVITVIAYQQVGGWSTIVSEVPSDMLSLIRPPSDSGVPWPGLILGVSLLGFYFWCSNQFMAQRFLSAKNIDHGRWGALFAGLLKLPVLFIMVLPGTFAILLYPDLERADLVYPTLMFDLLPIGLLGLVLAGFMAALMSQIDSTLNSAATLVTMDFIAPYQRQLTPKQLKTIGQWVTFVFMLLAVIWAPQIERFDSLFKYLQAVLAYTVPPIVAIMLLGLFSKRVNSFGAGISLIVSFIAGAILFWLNVVTATLAIHFLYIAPILFAICVLSAIILSPLRPAPDFAKIEPLVWSRESYHSETRELKNQAWYSNYRLQSLTLLAVTGIIVIIFW